MMVVVMGGDGDHCGGFLGGFLGVLVADSSSPLAVQ